MSLSKALERLAILLASLALSFGLIALLSGFFAGRDTAKLSGSGPEIGQAFPDQGHAHLSPGQLHPAYDSEPPTSGAHVALPVRRDRTELNDDQILQALEQGNVVILYGSRRPPAGLVAVARRLAAPFTPSLASVGMAVILARRPGTTGLIGLAWAHMIRVASPTDTLLRAFVAYWLGRGAP